MLKQKHHRLCTSAAFVVNLIEAKWTEFKLTGICTNQTLMNGAQASMDKQQDISMEV